MHVYVHTHTRTHNTQVTSQNYVDIRVEDETSALCGEREEEEAKVEELEGEIEDLKAQIVAEEQECEAYVCVCMCVCIYIHMYVCVDTRICQKYVCIHACIRKRGSEGTGSDIHTYIHTYIHTAQKPNTTRSKMITGAT